VLAQWGLADQVLRRAGLPAGTGGGPDRDRPGHVGLAELVLGEKAVQVQLLLRGLRELVCFATEGAACVADHFGSVVVGDGACLGEAGGLSDVP
jgi:hypothetical protein